MRYKPGDKIGVFTLIEYVGNKRWRGRCQCGHIWERTPARFRNKLDFCQKCDKVDSRVTQREWRRNNPKNAKWVEYRARCRKVNRDFTLTRQEFYTLLSEPCHYCGESSPCGTIDRKNSDLGYTPSNSLPACHLCNMMKRDQSREVFLAKAIQIAKHQDSLL